MRLVALLLIISAWSLDAQRQLGLIQNSDASLNGYTLWSAGQGAYLIDNCGGEVNRWESTRFPGQSCYLLENGHLLRPGLVNGSFNAGGTGGIIEEYDWDGNLVWSLRLANDTIHQHHDIEPLPNGNVLAVLWELRTTEEAEAAGAEIPTIYWSPLILEIEPIGSNEAEIVWEWRMWDHLVQDHDDTKENHGVVADHLELMNLNYRAPTGNPNQPGRVSDWIHINAIDYDPINDEILINSRHMDEFYIIDHSTTTEEAASHEGGRSGRGGDLLYRWGNPEAYDKAGPRRLYGQHDAKFVTAGHPYDGSISVFNNGENRPEGNFSTVDVITPPRDAEGRYLLGADGSYGPEELTWTYEAANPTDLFSRNISGAEVLSNGNVMICEGSTGRFFEVNQTGETLWEYNNPVARTGPLTQGSNGNVAAFRAERYEPDHPAFDDRILTPGDPIELEPLDYTCVINDGSTSTDEIHSALTATLNLQGDRLYLGLNETGTYDLRIYDQTGRLALTQQTSSLTTILDISTLATGIHAMHILRRDGQAHAGIQFFKS